ncbi:hypothetical protein NQZ68_026687 [Dissostichus eleginoides]|nr:hypothetical protein NQZ68_026687 [Dissostichus eleginoides]
MVEGRFAMEVTDIFQKNNMRKHLNVQHRGQMEIGSVDRCPAVRRLVRLLSARIPTEEEEENREKLQAGVVRLVLPYPRHILTVNKQGSTRESRRTVRASGSSLRIRKSECAPTFKNKHRLTVRDATGTSLTWIHFFCVFLANLKITGDEEELQRLTANRSSQMKQPSNPVRKVTIAGACPGLWRQQSYLTNCKTNEED